MGDYVQEMRKLIGHKPLLLCGASVIVLNGQRQVLMLRRTDNGCWCFPGGGMDLGESTEETARRELREETGLTADELSIFDIFSGRRLHYIYPNGDEVHNLDVVYVCTRYSGELKIDEESQEYRFFDIADLPAEISPPVKPVVEALIQRFSALGMVKHG